MEVVPAAVESSVGMIEIIGDIPAEDLFAAALARVKAEANRPVNLDRQAGEFTRRDVERRLNWRTTFTQRWLNDKVKEKAIETGPRFDPETGRACLGYWWVK